MAVASDPPAVAELETRTVTGPVEPSNGDVGELWLRAPDGSYCAMHAVAGPTRREHGLLVCEVPRVGACVMLSRLDETLIDAGGESLVTSRVFVGSRVLADVRVVSAAIGRTAVIELEVGARRLRRATWLDAARDAVVVEWTLLEGDACTLAVRPFVAMRPASRVRGSMSARDVEVERIEPHSFELRAEGVPPLCIAASAELEGAPDVWFRFAYADDGTHEDLFTPGVIRLSLQPAAPVRLGARANLRWSADDLATIERPRDEWRTADGDEDEETTLARGWAHLRQELFAHTCVRRERMVVVARFPDPGEHVTTTAMVVPALLSIDPESRAHELLASVTDQLVPAVTTATCSADAALWIVDAVRVIRTNGAERAMLLDRYYPVCLRAIEAYASGAGELYVADDGLVVVRAGVATWLDTLVDDARDARAGSPVELQALWHSALHTTADLATDARALVLAAELRALAKRARAAFLTTFWDDARGHLADRVRPDGSLDSTLRAFQTIALAATPPLLGHAESASALEIIGAQLVTERGLRLAAADGAAWPGFIGAFSRAATRAESPEAMTRARQCCAALLRHASHRPLASRYAANAPLGGSPLAWNAAELMAGARIALDRKGWSIAPGGPTEHES